MFKVDLNYLLRISEERSSKNVHLWRPLRRRRNSGRTQWSGIIALNSLWKADIFVYGRSGCTYRMFARKFTVLCYFVNIHKNLPKLQDTE